MKKYESYEFNKDKRSTANIKIGEDKTGRRKK